MLSFATAVFLLIITPGPGVLSAAGVGAAHGFTRGTRYVAGLFLGTNLVALAVISGLAAVVFTIPGLRQVLALLSVSYLMYLAYRIATAGAKVGFSAAEDAPGIRAGLLLQFINPKAYAVNTALFTGFPFYPDSLVVETIAKLIIVNAIWIPIHLVWLQAGVVLHRLDLPERTHRRINVAMAMALVGVVLLALVSSVRA